MISPVSSPGTSSPPPPAPSHHKKRPHESERAESSFDRLMLGSNAAGGLPQFLRKKVAFREASHSESLKGLVNANSNSAAGPAPAYVSYTKSPAGSASKTQKTQADEASSVSSHSQSAASAARDSKYGFKRAEIDLFSKDKLQPFLKWSRVRSIGPGLINMGNTCFLNSVMQCLFYTTPLAEFSLAREHSKRCKASRDEFCGLCVLERLMLKVHRQDDSVIRPIELVSRIKAVGKHFRSGRQEDSHEFLRLFIETLQKSNLGLNAEALKSLDARSKETTAIHRIFGGYLQSTVTCSSCRHVSRTFDQFLDLSLDVNKADNLASAFKVFTTPELLSKSNRYKCEACHRLVEAHKQFSIYKSPEILTIQLKRFSVNPFNGQTSKLNRPVSFPERVNISEWISDKNSGEGSQYRLYGVIVHEGHSCNSGHYHAFVRNSNDVWYSMNDCSVHQVSLDTVLRQRAYILFYQKQAKPANEATESKEAKEASAKSSIVQPKVEKTQRTMEEKMAAVREASKAYTSQQQQKQPPQQQPQKKQQVSLPSDSDSEVPQLVSTPTTTSSSNNSSELRASSMWHMIPLPESFNSHPPTASKRIKYNFSTQWNVSKI